MPSLPVLLLGFYPFFPSPPNPIVKWRTHPYFSLFLHPPCKPVQPPPLCPSRRTHFGNVITGFPSPNLPRSRTPPNPPPSRNRPLSSPSPLKPTQSLYPQPQRIFPVIAIPLNANPSAPLRYRQGASLTPFPYEVINPGQCAQKRPKPLRTHKQKNQLPPPRSPEAPPVSLQHTSL